MWTVMKRFVAVGTALTLAVAVLSPGSAWAATPGAPTVLVAAPGNTQVALTWTAPIGSPGCSTGCTDYYIEYSPDAGVTYHRFIDSVSTAAAVTVTGLTNGTLYRFRVSALVGADVGPVSAIVTATPFVTHTAGNAATYSACPATGVIPTAGFSDVTSTAVNCIKYYGITKGTTATTYSPYDKVTRWQMALFLTRLGAKAGITLPDGAAQGFSDMSGYSAEIQTAVNQVKQLGVTVGKTATTYAPANNVTREEMALFITRLLKKASVGPGGNTEYISGTSGAKEIKSNDTDFNFTDINQGTFEIRNAIINLFNLGVTDVQTATLYEPTVPMTRTSMATFMTNALAHTIARPAGLVLQASTYFVGGSPQVSFSVTHRTADFQPIAGSSVDTFKFTHQPVDSTIVRFDSFGQCTTNIAVGSVGNTKCWVDAADPKTDASGNLAIFYLIMPTVSLQDVWAWTTTPTTFYDNDVHASAASKITVQTHA
ncbi:MAG: S-layer homology domain-containing protein [Planctomycetaceae bacterium]